jgi:hypothetical protein
MTRPDAQTLLVLQARIPATITNTTVILAVIPAGEPHSMQMAAEPEA